MGSNIPKTGNVAGLVWCIGFIYIITRHQFLVLTPEMAADNIISTMSDFFILVDPENHITRINKATLDCLGYLETEVVGKPLTYVFSSSINNKPALDSIEQKKTADQSRWRL